MSKYMELLADGRRVAIWGMGYLGSTNLIQLTSIGIDCVVTDYDKKRIDILNKDGEILYGRSVVPVSLDFRNDVSWCGGDIKVVEEFHDVYNYDPLIHLVCVSNQKNSFPSTEDLKKVLLELSKQVANSVSQDPPLVIIETTFIPGTINRIVLETLDELNVVIGDDILLVIAPRKDRESNPISYKPCNYKRIVGCIDSCSGQVAAEVLEVLGHHRVVIASAEEVEVARMFELALVQIKQASVNQMSQAFPKINMRLVSELLENNWSSNLVTPSLGFGGYDQPMACQYLISGADHPEMLTIASEAHHTELSMVPLVSDLINNSGVKSVAILGIATENNTALVVNSPAVRLAIYLKKNGIETTVCEPFLTDKQVVKETGCKVSDMMTAIPLVDGVILFSAHSHFKHIRRERLVEILQGKKIVLDCVGQWFSYHLKDQDVPYVLLGDKV